MILVLLCVVQTIAETKSTGTKGFTLLSEIRDYKSQGSTVDISPAHEGFLPLADSQARKTPHVTRAVTLNSTVPSTQNTSTTTCQTVIQQDVDPSSTIVKHTPNRSENANLDSMPTHRSRRLLADDSYDTDLASTSNQRPTEDDDEVDSFLKVDDEALIMQLANALVTDGSGFSTFTSKQSLLVVNIKSFFAFFSF